MTDRSVQVFAAVRNAGGKEAVNIPVQFATWSAAEPNTYNIFGEDIIANIPAYGKTEVDTIWHPDANTYTVCVLIDKKNNQNTIIESDEYNNIIKKGGVEFTYSAGDPNIMLWVWDGDSYQECNEIFGICYFFGFTQVCAIQVPRKETGVMKCQHM